MINSDYDYSYLCQVKVMAFPFTQFNFSKLKILFLILTASFIIKRQPSDVIMERLNISVIKPLFNKIESPHYNT